MFVKCPRCLHVLEVTPGTTARCGSCGYTAAVPSVAAPPGTTTPDAPAPDADAASVPMHHPRAITPGTALVGLVLNVVLPGLGTLYEGRRGTGWMQLALVVTGILTLPILIGLAFLAAAYAWAVAGSLQHFVVLRRGAVAGPP